MKKILITAITINLIGCASITSTKLQPVAVSAACDGDDAPGAVCTLTNDKGSWFVKTPGTVTINKSYGDVSVDCKLDDARGAATYQSKNEGAVWGNIIAGGGIGYIVDSNTGAGFSYPPSMAINMSGNCPKKKKN